MMWVCTCAHCMILFFFFKQKTAYEMRISDWSSDVCSSDLEGDLRGVARLAKMIGGMSWFAAVGQPLEPSEIDDAELYVSGLGFPEVRVAAEIGRASGRERVCKYV